ncbi:conserved hypothetical protein [Talaromyces marneffei ATCC 18224]|uniref:Carbonic anhydrase n=1 Tax=Talaromyces marneffei (strain ATCC 18224 / CBS 334.59 / QM 7333) TaxID=441960 RepID=B6Q259_TALMQ|nr:conserved hypothetical protein [Talaromyces marneffei ATCC 18224]
MSTSRDTISTLLASNEKFASTFNGTLAMEQLPAGLRTDDGQPLFIRGNAGGRATDDVVRSLNVLRALVNMNTVVVVHHTDCGMTHVTEDEIRDYAKSKNPAAAAIVDKIDFGLWKEEHLEDSVRKDVRKLREEKSLDGIEVFGFVLDTQTAVVTEVQV